MQTGYMFGVGIYVFERLQLKTQQRITFFTLVVHDSLALVLGFFRKASILLDTLFTNGQVR